MFTGMSAFPLTPSTEDGIDERAFAGLIERLRVAGVDSIGALGSTGCYPYFSRAERARAARIAVAQAGETPVMVGIGAMRTSEVRALAEDAQQAGASAVLLAPVSYQPLTEDEVFELYAEVASELSVPLCVYDNPATTHFQFTDELYARIAELDAVRAVKVPGVPGERAQSRITELRALLPDEVALGIGGDQFAAGCLLAGAEPWFSVLGGLFPEHCLAVTRAAKAGRADEVASLTEALEPVWALFKQHGSLRVAAAAAARFGLTGARNLPKPLRALDASPELDAAFARLTT